MSSIFNPKDQDNIDRKIAVGLERIAQVLKSLIWLESTTSGLSPIQIQFLTLLLHTSERISIGFLASHFALTSATVSDAVTALERKGLIKRERKKEDKRTVFVSLSRKGKEVARKLSGWANVLTDKISDLADVQKTTMMLGLIHIIDRFQDDGLIHQPGTCPTCKFYAQDLHEENRLRRCTKFTIALSDADLRIDCPEHQPRQES